MRKIWIFIVLMLSGMIYVKADSCTNSEIVSLQKIANEIKVNYEVIEKTKKVKAPSGEAADGPEIEVEVTTETLEITIYNLNKDVFLIQTNDKDDESKVINYSDSNNGKYSFKTDNLSSIVTYKYEVYSNLSNCKGELIKTIKFIKPMKNPNANYQICIDNPTVPVCERYITKKPAVTEGGLTDYVEKYISSGQVITVAPEEKEERENKNFLEANWKYLAIGGAVIVVASAIYIIVSKKRSAL